MLEPLVPTCALQFTPSHEITIGSSNSTLAAWGCLCVDVVFVRMCARVLVVCTHVHVCSSE